MASDSFKVKKSLNISEGGTPAELGDLSVQGTSLEFHDGTTSSALITADGVVALSNKTIDADQNTITNIEDADIKTGAAIDRSKLASGTASHVLVNDASGVMSSEATLAKSRGGTGADNSSVTFPATGVIATEAGSQTLTNKTINGSNNAISNVSLTTAVTGILPKANGGTGVNLTTAPLELPEISTPATPNSGFGRIYFKADGSLYQLNDDGTESKVGAGSGSGINYLSANPDAESNTNGWVTYADAAGALPVDGTGGTPNISWSRTTSAPLRGTASFALTKDAANRQGEGASFDFTIASADQAKILTISAEYSVMTGTYADGDLAVYIYDVTNSQIIQPAGYKVLNVTGSGKISATFQTSASSTSYRFIVHVASTSASSYAVKFDTFSVGPQSLSLGTVVTDWVQYTPTFQGFGTVSNTQFWSRRVGDNLEVKGFLQTGTPTAVEARIGVGFNGVNGNVAINLAKVANSQIIGSAGSNTTPTTTYFGAYPLAPSVNGASYICMGIQTSSQSAYAAVVGSSVVGASTFLSVAFSVPIIGWSSNTVMSDSTDTRVVAATYTGLSSTTITSGTGLRYTTSLTDTHASYNTSTGAYVIPVSGIYKISVTGSILGSSTADLRIFKNGVSTSTVFTSLSANTRAGGATQLPLVAGDSITIVPSASVTAADTNGILMIERLSGPSQVAASEKIYGKFVASTTSVNASSAATLVFPTRIQDSHNCYNTSTGVYSAPRSGWYIISGGTNSTSTITAATNNTAELDLFVNGSRNIGLGVFVFQNTNPLSPLIRGATTQVYLNAGDQVSLSLNNGTSTTITQNGSSSTSYFMIGSL